MSDEPLGKALIEGRTYQTDLIVILVFSTLTALFVVVLPDANIIRILFGIPLLLFFPGYCLVSALWPRKNEHLINEELSGLERIALSIGLSISIVIFLGVILYYTPYKLTTNSTLLANVTFIYIVTGIALIRRHALPVDERFYFDFSRIMRFQKGEKTDRVFVLGISASIIIMGTTVGYLLITPGVEEHFSSFNILDVNGTTQDYPVNIHINEVAEIRIEVICHEYSTTDYTIVAGIDGANTPQPVTDWNGTYILTNHTLIERDLTLNHLQEFNEPFSFVIIEPGEYRLVWQLLIEDQSSVFETSLWVTVNE